MKRVRWSIGMALWLVACGGSNPEAESPESSAASEKSDSAASPDSGAGASCVFTFLELEIAAAR